MSKTVERQKRELIDELTASRDSLIEAAKDLPADRRYGVFLGTWSIMELLAHLAGWDFTNLQASQEILAGKYPAFFQFYDKDWASYNARLVEEHRRETFEEQLVEVESSHARLIKFLEDLPAKDMLQGKARSERGRTISIRSLLKAEARDERIHAEQVKLEVAKTIAGESQSD